MEIINSSKQTSQPSVNIKRLEHLAKELLLAIGEDPNREGLKETPRRFAGFWQEFINHKPGNMDTTFEVITTDQLVTISGIRVWSLCEHHLLPFWCDISIGYIAEDKVLGLSKFVRIAQRYAHRLQIQERLTYQIADKVQELTKSNDVAVLGKGEHLCMVMRGVKTTGLMTSSVMRGRFRTQPETRQEFFEMV